MQNEAFLDRFISNSEQYGKGRICLDCEVGEPHVCPLRWKEDHAQQVRALQILDDLASLGPDYKAG